MDRKELLRLQGLSGYPAVSILARTSRTFPDNKQDAIRVKNLVRQAEARLRREFEARTIEPLLGRIRELAGSVDYQHALDGLAIYASAKYAGVHYLPFAVRDRTVVDRTFATRDLVRAMNRSPHYWVLALSEKATRLYEGYRDDLIEVRRRGFPMAFALPSSPKRMAGGYGVDKSKYMDRRMLQYFRQVDRNLTGVLAVEDLPLLLLGVEHYLSAFNQVTRHGPRVMAMITGNYDRTTVPQLAKVSFPLVRESLRRRRQEMVEELKAISKTKRFACGIKKTWELANQGKVDLLLVEDDYEYPARLDARGNPAGAEDPLAPGVIDDLVDELVEKVLAGGGQAHFVEPGSLARFKRVAARLRYN
jgi:hypothetical protein